MIRIMVDSASDCLQSDNLYDYYIPMAINVENREYRAGIDLDSNGFYRLLTESKEFPRTSQPAPMDFMNAFESVKACGDELIYFAVSSALSGTYQCACMAKEMVEYEGIHIIDTKAVSHMIGIMVEYAKKLIAEGCSASEIVEKCEGLKSRVKVFAGLDTLEYLYRGGRMSRASAAVGEIAGIKPVISVAEDGSVDACGKCLGYARAMQFILKKIGEAELDPDFPVCSLYSYGEENCAKLEKKLAAAGHDVAKRVQLGPAIGAHTGPGVYAVIFVTK